ncbi:hypothetical protein [Polaromonas aquatica]|uniref:hypothetical protein n=1 Tax=Polaromonas aquatica TaxID=332657 RepID=UPI003D6615C7
MTPVDILNATKGKTVSHVWFGDYRAMYIELGKLTPPKRNNPQGEVTFYAGFHWQGDIKKPQGTEILGAEIINIEVQSNSELLVGFSNGIRLLTDVERGEPEWYVTVQDRAHLSAVKGRLRVEPAKS